MPPIQKNVVVVLLLMAVVLATRDPKDEDEIPDQSRDGKRGVRGPMAVMPVLGLRG